MKFKAENKQMDEGELEKEQLSFRNLTKFEWVYEEEPVQQQFFSKRLVTTA